MKEEDYQKQALCSLENIRLDPNTQIVNFKSNSLKIIPQEYFIHNPFIWELNLSDNKLNKIMGISVFRALKLLDLSYNDLPLM